MDIGEIMKHIEVLVMLGLVVLVFFIRELKPEIKEFFREIDSLEDYFNNKNNRGYYGE